MRKNNKWYYKGTEVDTLEDLPEDTKYFVYLIKNLTKNKWYVGYKSVWSVTNPPISKSTYDRLRKENPKSVRKTKHKGKSKKGEPYWIYKRRDVKKEHWRDYIGSSDELKEDIKNGDEYFKEILACFKNKKDSSFVELEELIKRDALYDCDCYNSNILGKYFKRIKC